MAMTREDTAEESRKAVLSVLDDYRQRRDIRKLHLGLINTTSSVAIKEEVCSVVVPSYTALLLTKYCKIAS